MSIYSGAPAAKEARQTLGSVLAALQDASDGTLDTAVTRHVAQAVGALLKAENAPTQPEGEGYVRGALDLLSESLALLQNVRSRSGAIETATERLASAMRLLTAAAPEAPPAQPQPPAARPAPAMARAALAVSLAGPAGSDPSDWSDRTIPSERDDDPAREMHSTTEIVVASPIEEVAARLLDFVGLHRWHPGLEDPSVEGSGIGAVRSYGLGGHRVRERLDAVDEGRGLAYTVLEGPLPVTNLRATYELFGDSGMTRVVWSAEGGVAEPQLAEGMALAAAALQDTSLMFLKIASEEGL